MTKVYIAAPLFSVGERQFNEQLNRFLIDLGFDTFLPQHDGHKLSELLTNGTGKSAAMKRIFQRDIEEIEESDIVVMVLDGRVPDEGACVEIGVAYAWGKECIGIKTDARSLMSDLDNPIIIGALKNRIARDFNELESYLLQVKGQTEKTLLKELTPI